MTSTPRPLERFRAPSLVDAVHEALRRRVLDGDLEAGRSVTEKDVAEWFAVARPTAKGAVERLVHDGLLRRQTNKAAYVPSLDVDDVRDLYFSRGFLEREVAATLAARRLVPDAALAALRAFDEVRDEGMTSRVVEHDIAFHRALLAALDSPRLDRMYTSLVGEVHLCMAQVQNHQLLAPGTIAAEHQDIVRAVRDGRVDDAVTAVDVHLANARDKLCSLLDARTPTVDEGPAT